MSKPIFPADRGMCVGGGGCKLELISLWLVGSRAGLRTRQWRGKGWGQGEQNEPGPGHCLWLSCLSPGLSLKTPQLHGVETGALRSGNQMWGELTLTLLH